MYLEYQGIFSRLRRLYFNKVIDRYCTEKNISLLDYGCGPGDMLEVCKNKGIAAVGVDAMERSAEMARERGFQVICGDYTALPVKPQSIDVVFLQSVIEHVEHPLEMISSLRIFLKSGGLMIISAPTPSSNFWDDPTHIRPYTPQSLKTLAELCDFQIIEINYVFSFLLNIKLTASILYKILNIFPFSLGSNIIGVFKIK